MKTMMFKSLIRDDLGSLSKVLVEKLTSLAMTLAFYPPSPPSLNVTAFQHFCHRFNTESQILFHLAYTLHFGVHLYSLQCCVFMDLLLIFSSSCLPVARSW